MVGQNLKSSLLPLPFYFSLRIACEPGLEMDCQDSDNEIPIRRECLSPA
jgi:hypothetical protein